MHTQHLMNYELAYQLKEAGFPQERSGYIFLHVKARSYRNLSTKNEWVHRPAETKKIYCAGRPSRAHPHNEWEYAPILSELIEACGDDFGGVIRDMFSGIWKWFAYEYPAGEKIFGATPEEAVARLWLALNKKNVDK